jgi:hypothetical protein
MTDLISVTVNDGKYTIQQTAPGQWEALRYGEAWPAFAGSGPDNLHVALGYEIHRLRAALTEIAAIGDREPDNIHEQQIKRYSAGAVAIARNALSI